MPFVLAALLVSCSTEDADMAVRFDVRYPNATRVAGGGFEAGDSCGLYMVEYEGAEQPRLQLSGNHANNSVLSYDGSVWSLSPKVYWEVGRKYDVYAYYPYDVPQSIENHRFSVVSDQSVEGAYERSDFLWALSSSVSYPHVVGLSFRHVLSKVNIVLTKGNDYTGNLPDDAVVCLHNLYTTAEIDLSSGSASYCGKPGSMTARKESGTEYSAIVVPQRMPSYSPVIEVISGGISYLAYGRMVFREGMAYTINVILSDNPENVSIDIGGDIVAW